MTRFIDGPAAGKVLSLSNAPLLLRVVIDERGGVDALDVPTDEPRPNEKIHLYTRRGAVICGFIDGRDPKTGKRVGRRFVGGDYVHHPDFLSENVLRDSKAFAKFMQGFDGLPT